MGFDFDAQKELAAQQDEGIEVHIRGLDDQPMYFVDENGEEKPVSITIVGAHSRTAREFDAAQRRRKIKPSSFTQQRIYDDSIAKMAHCTKTWQGFEHNGTPVPPSNHNFKVVYEGYPWVLEQVQEAHMDHSRFFERESKMPPSISE